MVTQLSRLIISACFICLFYSAIAQRSIYEPLDIDAVEFSFDDFGRMWTFDAVPVNDYEKRYGFRPDAQWLEDVRLSALQVGNGCSASFVSENGLIMTNHHCVRGILGTIQQEGENLFRDGYYAPTLEGERRFPDLFVDQLIEIEDVTERIRKAMAAEEEESAQLAARNREISAIENACAEESGLECQVVSLYNGGKYSLHKYKRYPDVRLVMAPDVQIAATGWDWDNFTYPRYELDFAFLRAYDEEGNPVESPHYFQWSEKGADEEEPVFVIGRPGNTDRLLSVKQLQYFRDHSYPALLIRLNELYHARYQYFKSNPEREAELLSQLLSIANSRKAFAGMLLSLNDEYLMAKKQDFENKLRQKVEADEDLKATYGDLWDKLNASLAPLEEMEKTFHLHLLPPSLAPAHFNKARQIIYYAQQMQLPEEERNPDYQGAKIEQVKEGLLEEAGDPELEDLFLISHANFLYKLGGKDHELVQMVYGGNKGEAALEYVKANSQMWSPEQVKKLLEADPTGIMQAKDPFIQFVQASDKQMAALGRSRQEAQAVLEVHNQRLGRLIFEAYGTQIPPDATATLRIADGELEGYEYNGTLAPAKTTYYGLWDRYHSFGKTYPWGLHEKWQSPPEELDLTIPICFASTNDIVGGNSGSAVINKNAEVVGLIHDGNLESLGGSFAFLPGENRAVATDSWGLMEALKYIYKTDRLVRELKGK